MIGITSATGTGAACSPPSYIKVSNYEDYASLIGFTRKEIEIHYAKEINEIVAKKYKDKNGKTGRQRYFEALANIITVFGSQHSRKNLYMIRLV